MEKVQWLAVLDRSQKAKTAFENTVYVHQAILPNGGIVTTTATPDRSLGRKRLHPLLNPWGYSVKNFDDHWTGTFGGVIEIFLLPTQETMDEYNDAKGDDAVDYGTVDITEVQTEPEFYGFTEMPGYGWDDEADEEAQAKNTAFDTPDADDF